MEERSKTRLAQKGFSDTAVLFGRTMLLLAHLRTIVLALIASQLGPGIALPSTHWLPQRGEAAMLDAVAAVQAMKLSDADQERYARLAVVFGFYEGAWLASPRGSNDNGAACGVMQVWSPERILPGATCAKVRADRVLGFRVGLLTIQQLEARCGSLRKALNSYATGRDCPEYHIALVDKRCAMAGVSCP